MYNERIRPPESLFSGAMRPQKCRYDASARASRDVPVLDIADNSALKGEGRSAPHRERNANDQKGCGAWGIEGRPLAMVYSPCQAWQTIYTPEVALGRGTVFSELDLPFEPSCSKRGCM